MVERWFYAHDDNKIGPFSSQQLRDLAVAGQILLTDTIWKQGIANGVLATKVKNLFPPGPAAVPVVSGSTASLVNGPEAAQPGVPAIPAEVNPTPAALKTGNLTEEAKPIETTVPGDQPATLPEDIQLQPEAEAPEKSKPTRTPEPPVRKRQAVAGLGAIIVGQDGTHVKFKRKCTVCGHEEPFSSTLPIINGRMNSGFFCPKCRKRREVALRGY